MELEPKLRAEDKEQKLEALDLLTQVFAQLVINADDTLEQKIELIQKQIRYADRFIQLADLASERREELVQNGTETVLGLELAIKDLSTKEKEKHFRLCMEHCNVENYQTYIYLSYKQARQLIKLAGIESTHTINGTGEARRLIRRARELLKQSEQLCARKQLTHQKEEKLAEFRRDLELKDNELSATFSLHTLDMHLQTARDAG